MTKDDAVVRMRALAKKAARLRRSGYIADALVADAAIEHLYEKAGPALEDALVVAEERGRR